MTSLFHNGADSLLVSHLLDPCHDETDMTSTVNVQTCLLLLLVSNKNPCSGNKAAVQTTDAILALSIFLTLHTAAVHIMAIKSYSCKVEVTP